MRGLALASLALVVLPLLASAAKPAKEWLAEKKTLARFVDDPSFVVKTKDGEITVGSAVLDPAPDVDTERSGPAKGAAIWIKTAGEEKLVDLRPALRRVGPVRVFAAEDGKTVFVFLEPRTDGPFETYIIIATHDGGRAWKRLADMKRPPFHFPPADLESFWMDDKGGGHALFKVESAHAGSAKPAGSEAVYVITTADGGKSWKYDRKAWAWNSLGEVSEFKK